MLDHIPPPVVKASPVRRTARIVLAVLCVAASIAATVWLQETADRTRWLEGVQRALRPEGFGLFAFQLAAVVSGVAAHGLAHLAQPRRIAAAWGAAGVLLAHSALVAGAAWLLAGAAPELSHGSSRYDSGALYPAWLTSVLLPAAVTACIGGLFPRPVPEKPTTPLTALRPAAVATAVGWAVGGIMLVLLLVMILLRTVL
ncbi:hypothetical protein [Kitasatospora sp. NPDC051914]|uniref:hypothetical protein n=1 Tax=Kitasatospora sp. NPDC051914 TaxID=3154945 RepID=UPI00341A79E6